MDECPSVPSTAPPPTPRWGSITRPASRWGRILRSAPRRSGIAHTAIRLGLTLLALLMGDPGLSSAHAQMSREYDLKAVFLFNLASFVEWPPQAFPTGDAPFIIGVLGRDPFGPALDEVAANEYVGTHPLVVRRFARDEDVTACHILFIADSEVRRAPALLRRLSAHAMLTVADFPGFVETGGMIGFATQHDQLRLLVNAQAVAASGLVVSSKLLEVAQVVVPRKPSS